MTIERRLAAILVADVVGYSKLIGGDEAGTLAHHEALRVQIIEPQIAKYAGRLFKSVGDGFLIEFASAVQAVSCAKAIQETNGQGPLRLRIGIHVGDVVVHGDDLMGGTAAAPSRRLPRRSQNTFRIGRSRPFTGTVRVQCTRLARSPEQGDETSRSSARRPTRGSPMRSRATPRSRIPGRADALPFF